MFVFLDPDNVETPLLFNSVQTRIIPAGKQVFLDACIGSAWEQALVIYQNDVRYPHQIGSFIRPISLVIPALEFEYHLNLIAFHKRSHANAELPWVASAGQSVGPVVTAWDDSAEDGDYRDLRVNLLTD
jgi:hypothetical protein